MGGRSGDIRSGSGAQSSDLDENRASSALSCGEVGLGGPQYLLGLDRPVDSGPPEPALLQEKHVASSKSRRESELSGPKPPPRPCATLVADMRLVLSPKGLPRGSRRVAEEDTPNFLRAEALLRAPGGPLSSHPPHTSPVWRHCEDIVRRPSTPRASCCCRHGRRTRSPSASVVRAARQVCMALGRAAYVMSSRCAMSFHRAMSAHRGSTPGWPKFFGKTSSANIRARLGRGPAKFAHSGSDLGEHRAQPGRNGQSVGRSWVHNGGA